MKYGYFIKQGKVNTLTKNVYKTKLQRKYFVLKYFAFMENFKLIWIDEFRFSLDVSN